MKSLLMFLVAVVSPVFGLPNFMKFRDYEIGQCLHTICCELHESEVFQDSIKNMNNESINYLKDVNFQVLGIKQSDMTMPLWKDVEKRICALPEETKVDYYDKFCYALNAFWRKNCLLNPTYESCVVSEGAVVSVLVKMNEYSLDGRCVYDAQKAREYGKNSKPLISLPSFG